MGNRVVLLLILLSSALVRAQDDGEPYEDLGGRSQYRFLRRKNEQGEIPQNALMNAKLQLDLKRAGTTPLLKPQDAGIPGWEWLGPGNIGGRIRSIVSLPNAPLTMLVGSVTGGIWRTFNGGDSWSPVDDFMANLGVTSIIYDPTNPLVLYAGTGEDFPGSTGNLGAGVFKSTDAGLTWTQLNSTTDNTWLWVTRLAHHPTRPNTLLATTANYCGTGPPGQICGGQVRRSTDGGQTWTTLWTFVDIPTQVAYNPNDPQLIVVGTILGLSVSTDGGIIFVNQTSGSPDKLPAPAGGGQFRCEAAWSKSGGPGICYASLGINGGEIWRTVDSARTWQRMNTGTNYFLNSSGTQANYDNAIWVDPTNANVIVVGGIDLWRSTNGGATLQRISKWQNYNNGSAANSAHADQHAIVPHPGYDGVSNRVVYFGNDGGIQMATDIATVDTTSGWVNLARDLGITQFYGGAAAPDGSIIVGGAQDNDLLHYRPALGTNNWRQPSTGDGGFSAINPTNTNQLFGERPYLTILRSDNGGTSYSQVTAGLTETGNNNPASFVSPFVMDPNNPSVLLAGGRTIWRTTNSGNSWSPTPAQPAGGGTCSAIDIAPGNSNLIYVGYDNGVISRSIDGGATWANVQVTGMPATAVTDIAISPSLISDVMVTFGGYATNRVWFTGNGGLTWETRNGAAPNDLPAIQINTVRFHPLNPYWVYVGTDLGVMASEDKGLNWSVLPLSGTNEGPANVEVDELFWQGNDHLIAATHGRGMFRAAIGSGIYVDLANPNPGDGSFGNPFQKVQDGINAQTNGEPIHIKTGVYQQAPVTFNKRGRVWPLNGPVVIR